MVVRKPAIVIILTSRSSAGLLKSLLPDSADVLHIKEVEHHGGKRRYSHAFFQWPDEAWLATLPEEVTPNDWVMSRVVEVSIWLTPTGSISYL